MYVIIHIRREFQNRQSCFEVVALFFFFIANKFISQEISIWMVKRNGSNGDIFDRKIIYVYIIPVP